MRLAVLLLVVMEDPSHAAFGMCAGMRYILADCIKKHSDIGEPLAPNISQRPRLDRGILDYLYVVPLAVVQFP